MCGCGGIEKEGKYVWREGWRKRNSIVCAGRDRGNTRGKYDVEGGMDKENKKY